VRAAAWLAIAVAVASAPPPAWAGGGERVDCAARVTINGAGDREVSVRVTREGFAAPAADTAHGDQAQAARRKEGRRALSRWDRSAQFVSVRDLPDSGLVRSLEWRYRLLAPLARVGTVRVRLAMWPASEMADFRLPTAGSAVDSAGIELSATTRLELPERATLDSVPEPFHIRNAFGEASCEVRRLEHGLEWTWTCRLRGGPAEEPDDEGRARIADEALRAFDAVVEVKLNGSEVHTPFPSRSSFGRSGGGGGHH
jgi:hypothetical protein